MAYRLRDHLHACLANRQIACLDVAANKYFALPRSTTNVFAAIECGEEPEPSPVLRRLVDLGVLVLSTGLQRPIFEPEIAPVTSALDGVAPSFALPRLLTGLQGYHQVCARLRTLPLSALIEDVRALKARLKPDARLRPRDVASSLLALQRFVAVHDHCLKWSLTTMAFTQAHHIPATLVFGVRMSPFAAHAWVQWDEVLLNDYVDNVRPYTPILTV